MKRSRWHSHPAVRTGEHLTRGERAADRMRSSMGSWPFVISFLVAMTIWMIANGGSGIDPYPWILLNLALSMLAGLQGAILLIAAKRSDQIAAEVAMHTMTTADQVLVTVRDVQLRIAAAAPDAPTR